jgi:predicted PurR-regulated permease PerM
MSLQRQAAIWLGAFAVVMAGLFALSNVLLPFAAGLILAYLLDPLADRLERLGIGRLVATIAILVLFLVAFVLVLVAVLPVLGQQVVALIAKMPETVQALQRFATERARPLIERFGGGDIGAMQASVSDVLKQAASWLTGFLQSLWSGGQAVVSLMSLLVLTPVVAFYLLYDWDRMIAAIDSWLPLEHRDTIRGLAREIDRTMSGFIRGQSLVCLFLAVFYGVGLSLAGLNFGLLIGIGAGLLSFIPYVGSLAGFIVSVAVAVAQFWPDWTFIVVVITIFVAGQFIEGNILSPKLVGQAVGLHPVWVMFALVASGSLFGFVGLLLAVPLAAAIGVLVRFGLRRYLSSRLYFGTAGRRPAEPDA